jgi:hypothetical protein
VKTENIERYLNSFGKQVVKRAKSNLKAGLIMVHSKIKELKEQVEKLSQETIKESGVEEGTTQLGRVKEKIVLISMVVAQERKVVCLRVSVRLLKERDYNQEVREGSICRQKV